MWMMLLMCKRKFSKAATNQLIFKLSLPILICVVSNYSFMYARVSIYWIFLSWRYSICSYTSRVVLLYMFAHVLIWSSIAEKIKKETNQTCLSRFSGKIFRFTYSISVACTASKWSYETGNCACKAGTYERCYCSLVYFIPKCFFVLFFHIVCDKQASAAETNRHQQSNRRWRKNYPRNTVYMSGFKRWVPYGGLCM